MDNRRKAGVIKWMNVFKCDKNVVSVDGHQCSRSASDWFFVRRRCRFRIKDEFSGGLWYRAVHLALLLVPEEKSIGEEGASRL